MSAKATRTLNPLHFEDLEPHRFEDMVRQLAYQHRTWKSIEATGRLGGDAGIDIRAVEITGSIEPDPTGEESEEAALTVSEHLWLFQCKREKELGPKRVRQVVADAIPQGSDPPHTFVLAAACDFSLKAREAFRQEAFDRGVQECHTWGKAELEDMLFLSANDHLLFAYFNISLQVRRRSLKSELRSRLSTKRSLIRIIGNIGDHMPRPILIRDARDEQYPHQSSIPGFADKPRWFHVTFLRHWPPDHLLVQIRQYFAYVDDEGKHWDAIFQFADLPSGSPEDSFRHNRDEEAKSDRNRYWSYWIETVPDKNRAFLIHMRAIHYDRILAIDEHGDCEYSGPHLLVEFDNEHGPFEPTRYRTVEFGQSMFRRNLIPTEENRIRFFPEEIPTEFPRATLENVAYASRSFGAASWQRPTCPGLL